MYYDININSCDGELFLLNFFHPAGLPTLILIKISVGLPARAKKLNNIRETLKTNLKKCLP